jgi:hypothetical protein
MSLKKILEELWDSRNGLNDKSNYIAHALSQIEGMVPSNEELADIIMKTSKITILDYKDVYQDFENITLAIRQAILTNFKGEGKNGIL